jgi:hypothetical protein
MSLSTLLPEVAGAIARRRDGPLAVERAGKLAVYGARRIGVVVQVDREEAPWFERGPLRAAQLEHYCVGRYDERGLEVACTAGRRVRR